MTPGAYLGSMSGRVFMILVAGVVATTLVTQELAERDRRELMEQFRIARMADRTAQLVSQFEAAAPADRQRLAEGLRLIGVAARLDAAAPVQGEPDRELAEAVEAQLPDSGPIAAVRAAATACPPRGHRLRRPGADAPPAAASTTADPAAGPPRPAHECRVIQLTLGDGTPLSLAAATGSPSTRPPPPHLGSWPYPLIFLACIGLLAYLVARMATRPLRHLASAAAAFGRDIVTPPVPERGPLEVRQATAAFNTMQAKIRQHVEERTQMLAAIAHDLQTPLTRLRLRLEKVADAELRGRLVDDLGQMQQTIREGLDLLRSASSSEPLETLDLDSLLEAVCADATDARLDVTLTGRLGTPLRGRTHALRRCLDNLLGNAVKYGRRALLDVRREGDHALVSVRDEGPGIPADQLEAVFMPFHRLEASRSRDTGGSGLGLAIARNIAEQHGGRLELRNHPEGGLEALLRLPLAGR